MTPDRDERLVVAFELIAQSLHRIAHPIIEVKRPAPEATVTHVLSDEEKLRLEQQGDPEDEIQIGSRWDEPGPRELEFLVGSTKPSK